MLRLSVFICIGLVLPELFLGEPAFGTSRLPCQGAGTYVEVDTSQTRMHLCQEGVPVKTYPVSIGHNGVGKTTQGDWKTPLGTYPLAPPRPSRPFYYFLLLGYPTPDQRKRGFTGDAVGIHGPPRPAPNYGDVDPGNWTAGCIAVNYLTEIEEVVEWVRANGVKSVTLY